MQYRGAQENAGITPKFPTDNTTRSACSPTAVSRRLPEGWVDGLRVLATGHYLVAFFFLAVLPDTRAPSSQQLHALLADPLMLPCDTTLVQVACTCRIRKYHLRTALLEAEYHLTRSLVSSSAYSGEVFLSMSSLRASATCFADPIAPIDDRYATPMPEERGRSEANISHGGDKEADKTRAQERGNRRGDKHAR